MFTNYSWPKTKNKYIRPGRPIRRPTPQQVTRPSICMTDDLLAKNIINETQHNTAQWLQKTYFSYLNIIEAPRLKTTCLDPADLKGNHLSIIKLNRIHNNWNRIRKVIDELPSQKKKTILQFLSVEIYPNDIRTIKCFLEAIDKEFKSNSCKKIHPAVKNPYEQTTTTT